MMKKSFYEAPEAELLLVKFERNFCESEFSPNSWSSGQQNWFPDEEGEGE